MRDGANHHQWCPMVGIELAGCTTTELPTKIYQMYVSTSDWQSSQSMVCPAYFLIFPFATK